MTYYEVIASSVRQLARCDEDARVIPARRNAAVAQRQRLLSFNLCGKDLAQVESRPRVRHPVKCHWIPHHRDGSVPYQMNHIYWNLADQVGVPQQ